VTPERGSEPFSIKTRPVSVDGAAAKSVCEQVSAKKAAMRAAAVERWKVRGI
jgi:hypothetical protein